MSQGASTTSPPSRWPWAGGDLGPLPVIMLALTVVTGLVDAVSFLAFGRVFVANMTGNVVFLAFALAGASGLSAPASLAALAAFLVGAAIGGRVARRCEAHRGRHVRAATAFGLVPLVIAVAVAAAVGQPVSDGARYALIVPLGIAMGIQNATARRLAIPDLTTTVLTMTITGLGADSRLAGGRGGQLTRRLIAVAAMFCGAVVSAVLVIHVDLIAPLAIAAALTAGCALAAHRASKQDAAWVRSRSG